MPGRKTKQKSVKNYLREIEQIHPLKNFAFLFFIISSIVLGFFIFSLELKKATLQNSYSEINVPEILILGALLLFSTLIITAKLGVFFKDEKVNQLKSNFYALLFVSTLFIVIQMIAVYQFRISTLEILPEILASYFIVLISFHLVLLIIAIGILAVLMFRLINVLEDPVKTLVYVTNPFEKLLLEIMRLCWNYQVITWMVIFLYFVFRY